ncbi:four helix bundle protein [Winogradskyella maritima]|uniref:Four helix bundle protein n=1 Tax=Winogradskyella maritima TaxID=1517766 RepID=A0ABV8AHH5_9FLAO|nr:four helix bundle protein [Winogradskyella maritima]
MKLFSFEKLNVWNESVDFVVDIYDLTKRFPDNERFGLVSQLRRASVSISSNIAEGTSRSTNADKARFTTIAFSSAMEVLNQLIICKKLNFINEGDYLKICSKLEKITNMLNALRNHQLNK